MVMVLMLPIQNYTEITGINPRFFYPANLYLKSPDRKTDKLFFQYLRVRPQIKQSSDRHIAADSTVTLQI